MSDQEYWVRIGEEDRHLGAGFLLTREYVLTAWHCLRRRSSDEARLVLQLPDGRHVRGQLCDRVEELDLALIAVDEGHSRGLPPTSPTDWPRPNVGWRSTYAPPGENTQLSGRITHFPRAYRSRAGGEFTGVQLTVEQELGDYSGYSGSPVDTAALHTGQQDQPGPEVRSVMGILMEQQLSRENRTSGTNVLVAASVLHAFEAFSQLHVDRLKERMLQSSRRELTRRPRVVDRLKQLMFPNRGVFIPRPRLPEGNDTATTNLVSDADTYLRYIREWEESAVISQAVADEARRSALRTLQERLLGDGSHRA